MSDNWSSESSGDDAPFDVTPGEDVLASPPERPRRGRAPVLLAMIAVLALVLAGGAFALVAKKSSASSSLSKLVPASAYAYVEVDLRSSSAAGLFGYLSHFPGSPATQTGAHKGSFRDTLLGSVFGSNDDIDYGRDVQPWLGDSAGLAVFRGTAGSPAPLAVIASTDAAKAKAGLARIQQSQSGFVYEVFDDDVLIAQHQSDLDAAQAQAKDAALPASGNYAADIATLPKGSLLTMWADLDKVAAATKSALAKTCATDGALGGECSLFGSASSLGALGALGGSAVTGGRLALGVTVADKVATLTARELGHKSASTSASVGDEIKNLPADTTGAMAFGDVSPTLNRAMKSLGTLSSAIDGVFATGLGVSSADGSAYAATASSAAVPYPSSGAFPSSGPLASAMAAEKSAMAAAASAEPSMGSADPSGVPAISVGAVPGLQLLNNGNDNPTQRITDALRQETGLTFPGDFTALLGDASVIAVGDVPLSSKHLQDLQVGVRSHPKDLAKAQSLAQTLASHLSSSGAGFTLGTKSAGDDFVLASSQSYANTLAAGGTLGANPQFVAATGDLTQAHFAAYVDLSKFTGILSATKEKAFSGFEALGIVERQDGDDAVIQVKLIAG